MISYEVVAPFLAAVVLNYGAAHMVELEALTVQGQLHNLHSTPTPSSYKALSVRTSIAATFQPMLTTEHC